MMATDYGTRLRSAMKHAELNQKALIKATGIAQSSVSSAMNRGSGSADTPIFAKACGVSAHWLATGEGDMLPKQPLAPADTAQPATEVIADPLRSLRVVLEDVPADYRMRAIQSALLAMAEWVDPESALAKRERQQSDAVTSMSESPRIAPVKRKTQAI